MVLLAVVGVPIALFWFYAEHLFGLILPDPQTSMLAGSYLRILVGALPGNVAFEGGKRLLTAEGIFFPITMTLFLGACTNVLLGWFLVWVSGVNPPGFECR